MIYLGGCSLIRIIFAHVGKKCDVAVYHPSWIKREVYDLLYSNKIRYIVYCIVL